MWCLNIVFTWIHWRHHKNNYLPWHSTILCAEPPTYCRSCRLYRDSLSFRAQSAQVDLVAVPNKLPPGGDPTRLRHPARRLVGGAHEQRVAGPLRQPHRRHRRQSPLWPRLHHVCDQLWDLSASRPSSDGSRVLETPRRRQWTISRWHRRHARHALRRVPRGVWSVPQPGVGVLQPTVRVQHVARHAAGNHQFHGHGVVHRYPRVCAALMLHGKPRPRVGHGCVGAQARDWTQHGALGQTVDLGEVCHHVWRREIRWVHRLWRRSPYVACSSSPTLSPVACQCLHRIAPVFQDSFVIRFVPEERVVGSVFEQLAFLYTHERPLSYTHTNAHMSTVVCQFVHVHGPVWAHWYVFHRTAVQQWWWPRHARGRRGRCRRPPRYAAVECPSHLQELTQRPSQIPPCFTAHRPQKHATKTFSYHKHGVICLQGAGCIRRTKHSVVGQRG